MISDLLKNQVPISAEGHQTVLEVARLMVEHNIGAVPVLRDGQLAGIFSERDLMRRVVAGGKDPATTDCRIGWAHHKERTTVWLCRFMGDAGEERDPP